MAYVLMPETELLISFLLASIAIELTPGPNMSYLALLSAMRGRKAGLLVVAGVTTGLATSGLLAALGAAAIIEESPAIYHSLRWAGVLFMLWLAYDCWRGDSTVVDYGSRLFARGFIINLLNPKAWLFYIALLPNFTTPNAPLLPQTLILTAISVTIATLVHVIIVFLGARIKPYMDNPSIAKHTRTVFTLILIGIAVWFAFSTR